MTQPLASMYAATDDQYFVKRVLAGAIVAAIAIANEDPGTVDHANRAAFSRKVLNDPNAMRFALAIGVASQSLDGTATDQQISNALASMWVAFSG